MSKDTVTDSEEVWTDSELRMAQTHTDPPKRWLRQVATALLAERVAYRAEVARLRAMLARDAELLLGTENPKGE
jgi:hypothetical protein